MVEQPPFTLDAAHMSVIKGSRVQIEDILCGAALLEERHRGRFSRGGLRCLYRVSLHHRVGERPVRLPRDADASVAKEWYALNVTLMKTQFNKVTQRRELITTKEWAYWFQVDLCRAELILAPRARVISSRVTRTAVARRELMAQLFQALSKD
jgi:hypothetical protein